MDVAARGRVLDGAALGVVDDAVGGCVDGAVV
jgi:hypothetical protein